MNRPLPHRISTLSALLAGLALAVPASSSAAVTWKDIQFGGFASQGFLANTGSNDYLGDTSDGTFDFREYALNASWSKGKFRVGAQVFGQELGAYGNDQIKLDWGTVDYQATQWLGFRAGRVKMPRGLYNEALDLDSVRPFVLLPQSVYDNRLRDFSAAFNGGMVYGNVELQRAGSVDYRLFYGNLPLETDSGASDYFNTDAPFPNLEIGIDAAYGGSVFWNTPAPGFRVGYSFSRFTDFNTKRFVTFRNATTYKNAPTYDRHLFSAEYVSGDWVLAAEAGFENPEYQVQYAGQPPYAYLFVKNLYYYVSASRRISQRFELGTYYSYSHFEQTAIGSPVVIPRTPQRDFAASVRCDVNDHLILKLEAHYMDGSGKIFDLPTYPQPAATRDNSWLLVAAKATVQF